MDFFFFFYMNQLFFISFWGFLNCNFCMIHTLSVSLNWSHRMLAANMQHAVQTQPCDWLFTVYSPIPAQKPLIFFYGSYSFNWPVYWPPCHHRLSLRPSPSSPLQNGHTAVSPFSLPSDIITLTGHNAAPMQKQKGGNAANLCPLQTTARLLWCSRFSMHCKYTVSGQ